MTNAQIADALELLADLLEFKGANTFRTRAYRNSARAVRGLSESVADLIERNPARLASVDGIGKGTVDKCRELVEQGKLAQLEELLEEVPASVQALLRIPGLGPRKAAQLYEELDISTLDQLRAACEAHQVRQLRGFGAKTEQTILEGLEVAARSSQRMMWSQADELARELLDHLHSTPGLQQMEMAGSYRRGKESVGDLDVLVAAKDATDIMDRLETFALLDEVLVRGETKMSIRTSYGVQIDLRVVPEQSFGAALQYFTGSKEHNVQMRGMARQQGLKVNEWGVFRVDGEKETRIAGATEEEVYATLDLPLFPPEIREARFEFDWAEAGPLPELVTVEDIRGDLHMHTTESDGKGTLDEMIAAARERGLQYIAITDHSPRVSMANGLDGDRLRRQWAEIDERNEQLSRRFRVLKGVECDILEKGGMDLPDDVLAEADWVLASIHYGQRQSRRQLTDRILEAVEHPHVHAIAHPTGRLINRREGYDVDIDAILDAAREHGKFLELNASPRRLDLNDVHCAAAREYGVPIVINTDAHSVPALATMRYGVLQARRGGLRPQDVANTWTWSRLQKRLGRKRRAARE